MCVCACMHHGVNVCVKPALGVCHTHTYTALGATLHHMHIVRAKANFLPFMGINCDDIVRCIAVSFVRTHSEYAHSPLNGYTIHMNVE